MAMHDDECAVRDAIVEGVRAWLDALKKKFAGRFPNDVRAGYKAVLQAVGMKATYRRGPATATAIGRTLGMSSSASENLIAEKARWYDWLAGDMDDFLVMRGEMRSDRFPEEWAEFVVDAWLDDEVTRPSESAADVMRNPKSRKDKAVWFLVFGFCLQYC